MESKLLEWDIYEVTSTTTLVQGVRCRGRLRKFCIEQGINVLVENAADVKNGVRFAVLAGTDVTEITHFLTKNFSGVTITKSLEKVKNPILSKLNINQEQRYEL